MFCSSISHSRGVCELQSRSCRAAGASPGPGYFHLLLLPVPPHPFWHSPSAHTATLWAGSRSSHQNPHPRKLCPLAEPAAPGLQPLTFATTGKARPPAGKNSHLGQSISHMLHIIPATTQNPNPATGLDSWLGTQRGSFSAKGKLYSNKMPMQKQK